MKAVSPKLWLALLLTVAFTLATSLELHNLRRGAGSKKDGVLKVLLGDGRRIFANHFITQADVYLHSGYYPSIFDRREKAVQKLSAEEAKQHEEEDEHEGHDHEGHDHEDHEGHGHGEDDHATEHEKQMNFVREPRDWIERFGLHFRITQHTHLEKGKEREVLPWLRLAAEMDPQQTQAYVDGAYILRKQLGKVNEAEDFLREGFRNNPNSYDILFELGRLYNEDRKDSNRARNTWAYALKLWEQQSLEAQTNSFGMYGRIAINLGHLEDQLGHSDKAIEYLEKAKKASPNPEAVQKLIDTVRARSQTNSVPSVNP